MVRTFGVRPAYAAALLLFGAMLAAGTDSARAQPSRLPCDTIDVDYPVDEPSFIDGINFVPSILRDQLLLKRYIRDPRFLDVRRLCSDTSAVDAIFLRSLEIADGDIGRALLVSLLGTMDHFRVGLRLPLAGVLWLPLTTETEEVFGIRHTHLPRRVLPDSAGRTASDRDKLQHFFGSAWVAYLTNSQWLANVFGNFVEAGEDAFVVGGVNDDRDKYANRLGQEFGLRLLDEDGVLPSDVLWHCRE